MSTDTPDPALQLAREIEDCLKQGWFSGDLAAVAALIRPALERPEGWEWTHEHDAALIRRDGMMCEQHPGKDFPHDNCAGPGQSWSVEGKDAVVAAMQQQDQAGFNEGRDAAANEARAKGIAWGTSAASLQGDADEIETVDAMLNKEFAAHEIETAIRALAPRHRISTLNPSQELA